MHIMETKFKNKKLKKFLKTFEFIMFLLLLNVIFFHFYYKELSLSFSFVTFLFIFLFVINHVLLLNIFRKLFFKILLFILCFVLTVYSLINFAYYKVFRTFWSVNIFQLTQVNKPMMNLLGDYFFLVPSYIYYLSASFFVLIVAVSLLYSRNKKKENAVMSAEDYKIIDFLSVEEKKSLKPVFLLLLIFILLNLSFGFFAGNYKNYVDLQTYSRADYLSDLGSYGFLMANSAGGIKKLYSKDDALLGGKSDLEIIKDNLKDLYLLNEVHAKEDVEIKLKTKKPHIIIYQMESVSYWPLKQDPSPMPYLSGLMDKEVSVQDFFANSCTTINAEFSALCSFYPESSGPISDIFAYNNYYCLPEILKEKYGYETSLYHANESGFWNRDVLAPEWGFDNLFFTPYYKLRSSDGDILGDVVEKIKKSDKPTFNYVVGFTSHSPHNEEFMKMNFYENDLAINPYEYELSDNTLGADADEETIRSYFGFLSAVDGFIKDLFDNLEKNDLLNNTIVVVYGDHHYYTFTSGNALDNFYNYYKIPFAMHVPGYSEEKVKEIASHIDIAPTLLNIIEGDDYEMPQQFIGQSIFSKEHSNSAFNKCLGNSFYANPDIIIYYDNLLESYRPIAFLGESAELKFDYYTNACDEIQKRSDNVIVKDELCAGKESNNKVINFDQETDADKDGLSDLREKALGTDPQNPDTDGDGYLDGVEVINGYSPL